MSLPRRLFDGDLDRYATEIGIGPELGALLRRGGSGVPATFGRADAYHDGTAYSRTGPGGKLTLDGTPLDLALLTDPRWSGSFDAEERALVDRVLPWSRTLHAAGASAGGGSPAPAASGLADLVDLCRERRERLILKPGAGYGGLDTFVGRECTDAEWDKVLRVAVERGGHVAQERVVPRPEPVYDPVTGTVDPWIAALGIFLTDEGYAGAHRRANRADGGAIVGLSSNPDTGMVGVFSHP
ncbi:hypothetical protein [Streptomyces zaomyceticus]|uniref:hypothetical protein n=1 Tax=Streptomyces zaomyceticus TaxID=68286 RepID=UPI00167297F2|nr:hypothetical protein [Streptomyces zaomyceticus]